MTANRIALLFGVSLLLAGCRTFIPPEPASHSKSIPIANEHQVGQTFTADYAGLSAIGLLVEPDPAGSGALTLQLFKSPLAEKALAEIELPLAAIAYPGYTYFYFPPLPDSSQEDYYFTLQLTGSGSVKVEAADPDSYLNGSLYIDGLPAEGQATLSLDFGRKALLLGFVREGLTWLVWISAGIFLFILPGWALLSSVIPDWRKLGIWVRIGLSASTSLSIYPLLFLWAELVGFRLGAAIAWLVPSLAALSLLLPPLINRLHHHSIPKISLPSLVHPKVDWPGLAMLTVIVLLIISRIWSIRSLALPLWGDAYQHTLMAQLLVDNNGLFSDWRPYAELESFTYHFGFHSLGAVFHWVTGLDLAASILMTGQLVNILLIISLAPLSWRITNNPWAGVFTLLSAGFLFSMPNYYLNWGRYTQLTGLVIISGWVYLAWESLERQEHSWRLLALSSILSGGLVLTHYRVFLIAILFIPVLFLFNLRERRIRTFASRVFWIGLGAACLIIPWIINLSRGNLWQALASMIKLPARNLAPQALETLEIGNLFFYLPGWAWIGLPILIGFAIWRRKKEIVLISLWWYLVFLVANPHWFGLPGAGIITSFAVLIAAFYPASLVIGESAGWLIFQFSNRRQAIIPATGKPVWHHGLLLPSCLVLLVFSLGIWGMRQRNSEIAPLEYALAGRPDLRAADWIEENLPGDARFLVNSFPAYDGDAIVGSDGGLWLPWLTNRQTSLPPLPYLVETGPRSDYKEWSNTLTDLVSAKGLDHPQVLAELKNRAIDYIYIGQQQGLVNTEQPLIKLEFLLNNPNFAAIYHQDRVWIFKILERVNS